MFPQTTVFILGAGASVDYGLLLGDKLKDEIIATLRQRKMGWVQAIPQNRTEDLAHALEQMHSPIDDWLSRNGQDDLQLGKYMIAGVIAARETENFLGGGWYSYLWDHLVRDVTTPDELRENKAYFVTFNYDRSLEEFIFRRMRSEWRNVPGNQLEKVACEFMQKRIIHLHGHLGLLKWQNGSGTRYAGAPSTMDQINRMASELLITTEVADDQNEYLRARTWLEKAYQIHFIGHGYHGDQLKRLSPQNIKVEVNQNRISGTYYEVAEEQRRQLVGGQSLFRYKIDLGHGFKVAVDYAKNMLYPANEMPGTGRTASDCAGSAGGGERSLQARPACPTSPTGEELAGRFAAIRRPEPAPERAVGRGPADER